MRAPMLVAIFVSLFFALFLPILLAGPQWRAAEDKARKRRMTDHRMMARLLRLDI